MNLFVILSLVIERVLTNSEAETQNRTTAIQCDRYNQVIYKVQGAQGRVRSILLVGKVSKGTFTKEAMFKWSLEKLVIWQQDKGQKDILCRRNRRSRGKEWGRTQNAWGRKDSRLYAKALSSEQKADCAGIYIFWGWGDTGWPTQTISPLI